MKSCAQSSDEVPAARPASSPNFVLAMSDAPIDSPVVEATAPHAFAADPIIREAVRILLVDDDEWIRDLITRVLARNAYQVTAVGGAEDALELLRSATFDLVISDLMLVGMNGLELTSRIVRAHPDLPVILITAHGDTEMMRVAMEAGVSDFIPKPFSIETVPLVVERNLMRRALERQRLVAHDDDVMFTTVQALAAAIDAKEPYTAQHSRRVSILANALAEALALPPTEQRLAELAALVHDVGKIGVPDEILNKPGKLSEQEWDAMRQHPVQGAEIVGRVPQLAAVVDAVRHHHERMDGRGYPDGLRGEAIPLLARVIAVADAYEVMTSNRVYRAALPKEEALERLLASAGEQFDPEVVAAFSRLWPDSIPL